jgi:hypothetical protein
MIIVERLTDDLEVVEVGRIEDGEITQGEEELLSIDYEEVWTEYDPQRLEGRFNGPIVFAIEVDDP